MEVIPSTGQSPSSTEVRTLRLVLTINTFSVLHSTKWCIFLAVLSQFAFDSLDKCVGKILDYVVMYTHCS